MQAISLRTLIGTIGLAIALVITAAVPTGYWAIRHANIVHDLDLKGRITAGRLARYIYQHDQLWRYQRIRLEELIELNEANGDVFHQRVRDGNDREVAELGASLEAPVVRRSQAIVVSGTTVGRVEVAASLRRLIEETALVTLFSFALGFSAFWALRVFPLRVLDRTLGKLELATRDVQDANERLRTRNAELQRRDEELYLQNGRFKAALANMSQGLCMLDRDQRLVVANERLAKVLDLPGDLLRPGMTLPELVGVAVAHGHFHGIEVDEALGELQRIWETGEHAMAVRELGGRTVSATYQPIPEGGWLATYEDITERRVAEARIAHLARHDPLTGLSNRMAFREQMEQSLKNMTSGQALAVFCLDLDRFKTVNDMLGHPAGDRLLAAVGERIRTCLRDTDDVARIGGDEFAILQRGTAQPDGATALAAERLLDAISAPYRIDGHQVVVGTSIGVSLAPADTSEPDQLLKNADLALYRAKADGRGTYRYFEPGMDARMQARRALEVDLRRALANNEFELFYQPLIDVQNETIAGFEALIRWNHPTRGLVMPGDFIAVTEETGLILPLGEWVLRQACANAAQWPDHVRVAVNLSPLQFKNRNLVGLVVNALAASRLAPGRLELEITESVLLIDNDATLAALNQLRLLGVHISMDDFGTGYSSLSYLRSFPFDKIKIDRSFIRELSAKDDSLAIIRAVTGLGHSLGMRTTAEGVETREQFERLKQEGCNEVQGYLFGKPQRLSEVRKLMAPSRIEAQAVA
jgi:diguanylate cyclase (GGDEF)-like protein